MSADVIHPKPEWSAVEPQSEPLFPHPRQKKKKGKKTVVYSAVRHDKGKDKDESEICEEEQEKKEREMKQTGSVCTY